MKGDVISGQSLMLWFQKDSLDIVGFGAFKVGSGFPKLLRSILWGKCQSHISYVFTNTWAFAGNIAGVAFLEACLPIVFKHVHIHTCICNSEFAPELFPIFLNSWRE